ncbi:MAG TPA: hypothetical protein VII49_05190 [Rhizomicrobium sp.]
MAARHSHAKAQSPVARHGLRSGGEVFEVRNGAKIRYTKGDSFPEIPFSTVHIVGNDSDLVAVTFHIYLPELAMETFADDESDYTAIGAFHDGFPSRRRI